MIEHLSSIDFLLASAAIFVAGVSRGMLGFGATLIIVPCLIAIYSPVEAVVVSSIIEIPAVLALLPTAVRQADWRQIAPLALASLLTIPVGAWLLVTWDPETSRVVIATSVIVFALLLATGWRYDRPPGLGIKLAVGIGSGLTSGLANIGGPLVVMFLVASSTAAAGVRAGIMAYFSLSAAYRLAIYALLGIYATSFVWVAMVLAIPYLAGIALGTRLFKRVSERLFIRLAIGLVLCAGLVALLK